MKDKFVCFAGHRAWWKNVGVEQKLSATVEKLIQEGYRNFYDGGMGNFDRISAESVFRLKRNYPDIKIIRVETYYHEKKESGEFFNYDECFTLELESVYFK